MKKDLIDTSNSSTKEKNSATKADSKKSAKADKKQKKPSKIKKFFKDLKAEIKKIVWPTKKQVVNNTVVVLIAMVFSGVFIWGIDTGLKLLFDLILKR